MTPDPTKVLVVEDNRMDAVLLQEMLLRDAPGQFDLAWTSSLRETLDRIARDALRCGALGPVVARLQRAGHDRAALRRRAGDADPGSHRLDGRAGRRRGRALRRGGLPGQGADGRPLDRPGGRLCHRAQAGRGGLEGGERLGRAGQGRRRAGQPRQGPFPGGLEPRTAHAPDARDDGLVDAPGPGRTSTRRCARPWKWSAATWNWSRG